MVRAATRIRLRGSKAEEMNLLVTNAEDCRTTRELVNEIKQVVFRDSSNRVIVSSLSMMLSRKIVEIFLFVCRTTVARVRLCASRHAVSRVRDNSHNK